MRVVVDFRNAKKFLHVASELDGRFRDNYFARPEGYYGHGNVTYVPLNGMNTLRLPYELMKHHVCLRRYSRHNDSTRLLSLDSVPETILLWSNFGAYFSTKQI